MKQTANGNFARLTANWSRIRSYTMALVHRTKANFNWSRFFEVTMSKFFYYCALLNVGCLSGILWYLRPSMLAILYRFSH